MNNGFFLEKKVEIIGTIIGSDCVIFNWTYLLFPFLASSSSVNEFKTLLGWFPKTGIDCIRWMIFTSELVGVFRVTTALPPELRSPQIANSKFGLLVSIISMEAHFIMCPPEALGFGLLLITQISPCVSSDLDWELSLMSLMVAFCCASKRKVKVGSDETSNAFIVINCPKSLHPCVGLLAADRVSPVVSRITPAGWVMQIFGFCAWTDNERNK